MRLDRLCLEPTLTTTAATATSIAASLSRQLNIFATGENNGGYHAADLAAHLLYGARLAGYRRGTQGDMSGQADVTNQGSRFRLRREAQRDHTPGRLTIASLDATAPGGATPTTNTIEQLLGGIAPVVAARLLAVDCASDDFARWVFSEQLAREMRRIEAARPVDSKPHASRDALHARRDRLSLAIEQRLAEARTRGVELDAHWRETMTQRDQAQLETERLRSQMSIVESELAEVDTQLRYRELSQLVEQTADEARMAYSQPLLEEIDDQIEQWRRTLAELETRESRLRSELSQHHPDESSTTLPIAQQRGCLAVARRLLDDLTSEVARFSPSSKASLCLCGDAHARLSPLVSTLTAQIDALAQLVTQYELATDIAQLEGEARQVARTQHELRAQIDFLLARRQELLRQSRLRQRDNSTPADLPQQLAERRRELRDQHQLLSEQLDECEHQLADYDRQCSRIERERAELLGRDELTRLRNELDEVSAAISTSEQQRGETRSVRPRWRASELLAKLTDGRLRELRLVESGRNAVVVDQRGDTLLCGELAAADQQLVALALHLASISTLAAWGIELPTIVANPCHALSDSQSLLVAVVLHDFAQSGHQLLVVSERTTALARWRQLGVLPIDWQRTTTTPSETLRQPLAEPAVEVRTHVATTQFRPAVVSAEDEPRLLTSDGLERFPVFGPTTAATFAAIDLHTVGQLVEADCETVARRLNRDNVTPAIVALWQTHLGLLCFVPQIDLIDADLLVAAGIDHADVLADIDLDTLDSRIGQLLGSPRGERFARRGYRYSRATAKRWRDAARGSRQWRAEQADWQRWQQRGSERRRWLDPTSSNLDSRTTARSVARERSSRTASTRTARSSATKVVRQPAAATTRKSKYKFRLERSSNVVDAPSIGPKTAKRLAKVGVRTVSDLLAADPARLAEKLGTRHITPEVLVAWQHQAQLACRVPNLRALDTQLLVGCGFTTPEAIAHASASELHEFVKAFAATTEGKRYLREAPAPGIERVEEWIDLARHQRSLEAA